MAKQQISCPCNEEFELDIPDRFIVAEDPQLVSSFRRGNFLLAECPRCGMELETEFPFTIEGLSHIGGGRAGYNTIRFLPEFERSQFLSGKIKVTEERLAIGREELIEKMAILEEQWDDRIIELIKVLLLEKIKREGAGTGEDIDITFIGRDETGSLKFHLSGLRPDETALVKTPISLYEKAEEDLEERLKENPFREILKGPYVSINKINLEV